MSIFKNPIIRATIESAARNYFDGSDIDGVIIYLDANNNLAVRDIPKGAAREQLLKEDAQKLLNESNKNKTV